MSQDPAKLLIAAIRAVLSNRNGNGQSGYHDVPVSSLNELDRALAVYSAAEKSEQPVACEDCGADLRECPWTKLSDGSSCPCPRQQKTPQPQPPFNEAKCREEFEAWIGPRVVDYFGGFERLFDGDYKSYTLDKLWQCWLAASRPKES